MYFNTGRLALRFDVGKIRYTTKADNFVPDYELRFDVGKIRYTTAATKDLRVIGCGLM